MGKIRCPHCRKSLGGPANDGGLRVRVGIVLIDEGTGRVHGPCPFCKGDVDLVDGGTLSKSLHAAPRLVPGVRVRKG